MPKSTIVKELANASVSIETALFRLKVILSELDEPLLNRWIEKEIKGYSGDDILPKYRVSQGQPFGTILVGSSVNMMKYTNHMIPIEHLDKESRVLILEMRIYQGISALDSMNGSENLGKPVTPESCAYISRGFNGDIVSMTVKLDPTDINKVISTVKIKVLDILMKLEKEFGNLDELDAIEISNPDEFKKNEIKDWIVNFVFENNVEIGDNNNIVKSNF